MVFCVKEKKNLANVIVQNVGSREGARCSISEDTLSQEQGSLAGREAGRGAGPLLIREDPFWEGETTPGPKYSY